MLICTSWQQRWLSPDLSVPFYYVGNDHWMHVSNMRIFVRYRRSMEYLHWHRIWASLQSIFLCFLDDPVEAFYDQRHCRLDPWQRNLMNHCSGRVNEVWGRKRLSCYVELSVSVADIARKSIAESAVIEKICAATVSSFHSNVCELSKSADRWSDFQKISSESRDNPAMSKSHSIPSPRRSPRLQVLMDYGNYWSSSAMNIALMDIKIQGIRRGMTFYS